LFPPYDGQNEYLGLSQSKYSSNYIILKATVLLKVVRAVRIFLKGLPQSQEGGGGYYLGVGTSPTRVGLTSEARCPPSSPLKMKLCSLLQP
jgi:hypothetical protein